MLSPSGPDPNGGVVRFGSVGYAYNIGKYEVTTGEYTAFLNAVAAIDSPQRVVLRVNGVMLQDLPGVSGEGHIALHVWRDDAGGFTDITFRPSRQ